MKKIFVVILSFIMIGVIYCQKYDKAIVTDINYLRRESIHVHKETFPFYFHHQEFIDDIQADIKKYVQERFKVKTVEFRAPGKVTYKGDYIAPKINAPDIAKNSSKKNVVYIGVESILQMRSVTNNMAIYEFITRIKAYNSDGKKVHKFKNRQPFAIMIGEEITGPVELAENDFYALYFDGLALAFEGKKKKTQRIYFNKPITNHYDDFLKNAEKYYITRGKKDYTYGRDMNNQSTVINFTTNFWQSRDGEFDLGNLFESNEVNNGYNLTNHYQKEDYIVKLSGGETTVLNFLSFSSDIKIVFKKGRKEIVGEFSYGDYDDLEGSFRDKNYHINWNEKYNCAEVYHESKKIILINELPDKKVLYVDNNVNDEQLGDVFNLVFIYDFSVLVREEIEAKAANDDLD